MASCPPPPRPLRSCGAEALTRCCGPADAPFDLLPAGRQPHGSFCGTRWVWRPSSGGDISLTKLPYLLFLGPGSGNFSNIASAVEGRAEQDLMGQTSSMEHCMPADADGRAPLECWRWWWEWCPPPPACAPPAPGSSLSSPSLASLWPPSTAAMARLPPMNAGWSVLMYASSHATQSRIIRSAGACVSGGDGMDKSHVQASSVKAWMHGSYGQWCADRRQAARSSGAGSASGRYGRLYRLLMGSRSPD